MVDATLYVLKLQELSTSFCEFDVELPSCTIPASSLLEESVERECLRSCTTLGNCTCPFLRPLVQGIPFQ